MNNFIAWADKVLSPYDIVSINLVFNKSYSSLYTVETNDGLFYLKVNNPKFTYEHNVLNYLYKTFPTYVPKVIHSNQHLNCFITKDSGEPLDEYLRNYLKEGLIIQAIDKFLTLQKTADVNILINLGVRDLSTNKLVDKFYHTLSNCDYICHNLKTEIIKAKNQLNIMVEEFHNLGIDDSLEHGDFHFGNMLHRDDKVVFIDWAEATITNPLFSFISFRNSLVRRLNINMDTHMFNYLNDRYLEQFAQINEVDDIDLAVDLSKKLYPLYSALSLMDLISLGGDNDKWKDRLVLELNSLTCY
jgi:hypothetical protein